MTFQPNMNNISQNLENSFQIFLFYDENPFKKIMNDKSNLMDVNILAEYLDFDKD